MLNFTVQMFQPSQLSLKPTFTKITKIAKRLLICCRYLQTYISIIHMMDPMNKNNKKNI